MFCKLSIMCVWLLAACLGVAPVRPNYVYSPLVVAPGPIVTPTGIGSIIPTGPPNNTIRLTGFPLIDPRLGTSTPSLKLRDAELLPIGSNPSGGNIETLTTPISNNGNGLIFFPGNKSFSRKKRQTTNCGCVFPGTCPTTTTSPGTTVPYNPNGAGLIDIRIVGGSGITTPFPVTISPTTSPQQCPYGLQLCCQSATPQYSCGSRLQITNAPTPQPGQSKYGDFPWMVVILTTDNSYIGGGTLIDTQNVVTAAHKIANYPNGVGLKVRLGEWDASGNYEPFPFRDYTILRVWIHEAFNPNTLQNTIAVIRIAGTVPSGTANIIPICLPPSVQSFDGQRCWVSGWGKDSFLSTGQFQTILKATDVPIVSSSACETALRNTKLGTAFTLDRTSFICAGGEANKDSCTGDGGSGLVCETTPGRWTLAGLVAWGVGCATQGVPAAYVNIVNYLPWIASKQALT